MITFLSIITETLSGYCRTRLSRKIKDPRSLEIFHLISHPHDQNPFPSCSGRIRPPRNHPRRPSRSPSTLTVPVRASSWLWSLPSASVAPSSACLYGSRAGGIEEKPDPVQRPIRCLHPRRGVCGCLPRAQRPGVERHRGCFRLLA